MLVFRGQSKSTGNRCEGPQIYSMPTDVYILLSYVLRISHDLYYYPFVKKSYVVKLFVIFKALHGRLKSQRDGTGGKLTVDPPFLFRRERGTGKI